MGYEKRVKIPGLIVGYLIFMVAFNELGMVFNVMNIRRYLQDFSFMGENLKRHLQNELSISSFYSVIDMLTVFYLLANGTVFFMYMFFCQILARGIVFSLMYLYVFDYTLLNGTFLFYMFFIAVRMLGVFFIGNFSLFLKQRKHDSHMSVVKNFFYYKVYYTLVGCSLNLFTKCIFSFFRVVLSKEKEQPQRIVLLNIIGSGMFVFLTWYFLWVETRCTRKRWIIAVLVLLDIARFFFILVTTSQFRCFVGIMVVSEPTILEHIFYIVHPEAPKKRMFWLFFLSNFEAIVIGLAFNVSLVLYWILLWRLNTDSECWKPSHRSYIEEVDKVQHHLQDIPQHAEEKLCIEDG
ncbi:hypothetical protein NECID01_1580 [Nematocida sp. AWRm77]|nr:hypothetical protein NECID01_1580 [Nematocida sp. AWRm77]